MRTSLLSAVLAIATTVQVQAQDFPTRPITMIVPFAAGGPTDTVARVTADAMGRLLGQSVVVENVAGAGGTMGSHRATRAEPDGYTLLLHHLGLATSVSLYRKLPFDPLTDLKPVGLVSDANMAIIARPDFAASTMAELAADIRKRGDQINFAHSGLGAASQLCGMLFMAQLQTKMTEVPFKGGGPVVTALVGKQVDLGCEQATVSAPLIKANKVKAYGVTSAKRLPSMPDVPTAAEGGVNGLEISVWHGLYVPAKTPDAIVQKLSKALGEALRDPNLVQRFSEIATVSTPDKASPEALAMTLKSEIERWRPLITAAGQYAD
jgi:tripartite-type tricarboxylate transporter receptor subunit TctC